MGENLGGRVIKQQVAGTRRAGGPPEGVHRPVSGNGRHSGPIPLNRVSCVCGSMAEITVLGRSIPGPTERNGWAVRRAKQKTVRITDMEKRTQVHIVGGRAGRLLMAAQLLAPQP